MNLTAIRQGTDLEYSQLQFRDFSTIHEYLCIPIAGMRTEFSGEIQIRTNNPIRFLSLL